ncbi:MULTISPECIES: hypothetical protein [unclassified Variovorax]|uniref:hypothetical protein n=1 Tax=unclassified Variovorax TaxID=663243 RepID=UPI000CB0675F|nr:MULTISPECIES: hypothetical protein [unclassified Variovorax]PNG49209.1 hypothetical protein CHC06_06446 [Variovorax sp. B2]PNG49594.1 hypothetical protein CHC07_06503 [Variovorax sp. B4]VTV18738.1 hypothetical protein WDL1P2_00394 [Variovorax sp. WDL1]
MTTTSTRTLSPIIRDRAGAVQPIPAAIAAITGQPLTEVGRMLWQCIHALNGLAGVDGEVSPEDASHAALHRFGYQPQRLYVDMRRHPLMGELLRAYAASPGPCERLFVICESGDAFAFMGNQASAWTSSAPTTLTALVRAGTVDLDVPVRFAFTVTAHRLVPIASPDHKFLESMAIPAFALADAYNIEVLPVGWPYWNLSFPGEMTDGGPGSGATMVCGEHEMLSVINDRVRLHKQADESVMALMDRVTHACPARSAPSRPNRADRSCCSQGSRHDAAPGPVRATSRRNVRIAPSDR